MKKLLKNEMSLYLVFGILTTIVYFSVRFMVIAITSHSLLAVVLAQLSAIVFAFFTNKYIVFSNKENSFSVVLKQFLIFLGGRLFVFCLDVVITFLAIEKFSSILINIFSLNKINYSNIVFSHSLTRHFIGSPELLNEFIWALVVQFLAIIINYIISKRKVFNKKSLTSV